MKKLSTILLSATAVCLLAAGLASTANAAEAVETDVLAALASTANASAAPDILGEISSPEAANINLPENSDDPVVIGSGATELSVPLPYPPPPAQEIGEGGDVETADAFFTSVIGAIDAGAPGLQTWEKKILASDNLP